MDVVVGGHVITTGDWGSDDQAFTVSRGSRGATPYTSSGVPRFIGMLPFLPAFPVGQAFDPEVLPSGPPPPRARIYRTMKRRTWAYMVMASLAWSLKAWSALVLPEQGRWAEKYRAEKRSLLRMEFSTFCVAMIQMPCQVVRGGRRLIYRLLAWNPWQGVFLRLVERLHGRRLC